MGFFSKLVGVAAPIVGGVFGGRGLEEGDAVAEGVDGGDEVVELGARQLHAVYSFPRKIARPSSIATSSIENGESPSW